MRHLAAHARVRAPRAFLERRCTRRTFYLACGAVGRSGWAGHVLQQFIARVPDYVLRVRIGRDVVDEVQQKLRERLLMGRSVEEKRGASADGEPHSVEGATPKIGEYSGKGALGGWVRVAAVRTALNETRGRTLDTEPAGDDMPSFVADPELAYVKEHAQRLFMDAFQRVLGSLPAKERSILRLHYIDGLTMDQLARLYQTPRSTIARRVADARQAVLAATESLLRDERRLSPSAVASVIRQARSRLQVTITRLLG
ncbi:MAG: sigma factor-like helix-turn-helix DNA-binding protein [Polyangiaceae bacterium]